MDCVKAGGNHDWQPTDTEGHSYECPKCGTTVYLMEEFVQGKIE